MTAKERFIEIYNKCIKREGADKLLEYLLSPNSDFFKAPASARFHSSYEGGLCEHSLNVYDCLVSYLNSDMSKSLGFEYSEESVAIVALLHDLCKIDEFNLSSAGLVTGYSVKGELIGHLVMGAMKIEKKASELGIKGEKAMLLQHMVISHHGEPEFGASVRPMFLEAEILSQLDKLDATIYEINEAVAGVNEGEFTQRMWALDNRKLYNHGRKTPEAKAKLD